MNINGMETFLIGMGASALVLTFFIYLRKRAPDLHKIPHLPTFKQSAPTFHAKKSRSVNLRKKIGLEPIITGYIPVYPIVRPEAPLS